MSVLSFSRGFLFTSECLENTSVPFPIGHFPKMPHTAALVSILGYCSMFILAIHRWGRLVVSDGWTNPSAALQQVTQILLESAKVQGSKISTAPPE